MSMTEGPDPGTADLSSDAPEAIAVVIPLYNERENAATLFRRFRDLPAAKPDRAPCCQRHSKKVARC